MKKRHVLVGGKFDGKEVYIPDDEDLFVIVEYSSNSEAFNPINFQMNRIIGVD